MMPIVRTNVRVFIPRSKGHFMCHAGLIRKFAEVDATRRRWAVTGATVIVSDRPTLRVRL